MSLAFLRSELQCLTDRVDSPPETIKATPPSMRVNETDHLFGKRSSSAPKKAAAAFKISLARRSSRFSRSRRRIRSDSPEEMGFSDHR